MKVHKLCLDCKEECKQESHVTIVSCLRVQSYRKKIRADKKKRR